MGGLMNADEMRTILEGIARDSSNPNARVSAIRALRRLDEDEQAESQAETVKLRQVRGPGRLAAAARC